MLSSAARDVARALSMLYHPLEAFCLDYDAMAGRLTATGIALAVCTVYNGDFPEELAPPLKMGVSLFNDATYPTANRIRADVIELRSICTESADYANPIEPSGPGGLKIAKAIAAWLRSSGAESTGDATT